MVVIDTEPWAESTKREDVHSIISNRDFFGFQDLASDYYQVAIELSNISKVFFQTPILSNPLKQECKILQQFTSEVLLNIVLI